MVNSEAFEAQLQKARRCKLHFKTVANTPLCAMRNIREGSHTSTFRRTAWPDLQKSLLDPKCKFRLCNMHTFRCQWYFPLVKSTFPLSRNLGRTIWKAAYCCCFVYVWVCCPCLPFVACWILLSAGCLLLVAWLAVVACFLLLAVFCCLLVAFRSWLAVLRLLLAACWRVLGESAEQGCWLRVKSSQQGVCRNVSLLVRLSMLTM